MIGAISLLLSVVVIVLYMKVNWLEDQTKFMKDRVFELERAVRELKK